MGRQALHCAGWRISSYSANGSTCVEVAHTTTGTVMVRDSTDRHGPVLAFTPRHWHAFTAKVKAGRVGTA